MTTYNQTDVTNQQVVIAAKRVAQVAAEQALNDANHDLTTANTQLQLIQASIAEQNAVIAATPVVSA